MIYWLLVAVVGSDDGLTIAESLAGAAILAGMQTVLATIYVLPLFPIREVIIGCKFPFLRLGYVIVFAWVLCLVVLPNIGTGATPEELVSSKSFWVSIFRNELIALSAAFLWGLTTASRRANRTSTAM
jgi:hypothetical protein